MIRRFLLLVLACVGTALSAQLPRPKLDADLGDLGEPESILKGHATMRDGEILVTADVIRYNSRTEEVVATGNVVYTRRAVRMMADKVVLHRVARTFTAEKVRLGSYPYYIQGSSADGTRDEITIHQARVTYGEPGPWQPTATANTITVSADGRRVRSESAQVGIGHLQPVPFPKFQQNVSEPFFSFVTLTGGYRGSLGAFVDGGIHLPVWPGVRLGGDLGYYSKRGLLLGPSGSYFSPTNPDDLHGVFRTGYINDHGNKGVDLLNRSVPENRGFVEWQHQQQVSDQLSLNAQLNWWKDSEVVRDFRPREFFPVQQPDTFVEATYTNPNSFVSIFTRAEPNSFEIVQQRTPEIRFDLLPIAVGGGIYERFDSSIVMLHERPLLPEASAFSVSPTASSTTSGLAAGEPTTWTTESPYPNGTPVDLRSTRMDAYYGLSRPIAPTDWFAVTPVVGGRVTHYMNTRGATRTGSYTRTLGEIGADAELRTSGTFDYKNEVWRIDGLRHLFTPRVSYRYIPRADRGQADIPMIDRQVFSTYLQPLGLADARNIDQLQSTNTLRLAFDNVLQTRDPKYGARDLLSFSVANDFRFRRRPGERDVSEIHTELAASPVRWLDFGFYNSFSPQRFSLREFNSGVTIRNGNAWSVRFANNFLRKQLQDYVLDGRARINEQFDGLAQLRYDQRKHRFTEQVYGLVQNLDNTWRLSYLISFYSGRRRESSFGVSVQIDTIRF